MKTVRSIALLFALAVGIGVFGWSASAVASRIDLSPALTTVGTGNSFSIDVILSGLNAATPAFALTDFDIDVSYNAALLHASGVTFGAGLGIPPGVTGFDLSTSGIVDVFAVSFANYAALRGLQGDTFTLATLTFVALAPGTDSLSFVQNANFIVDMINAGNQNPVNAADPAHCQTLSCVDVGGARVIIRQGTSVPEPGSLPLVLAALAAALGASGTLRSRR